MNNQQKMEESIAYYRKALELNPNDDDAKFNYELAKYITQKKQEQELKVKTFLQFLISSNSIH